MERMNWSQDEEWTGEFQYYDLERGQSKRVTVPLGAVTPDAYQDHHALGNWQGHMEACRP
jgi:hypothetical protein